MSIFFAALYFLNNLLKTLYLLIHKTFYGILASLVPFLLPVPTCLPFLFASKVLLALDLEWITYGFFMMTPSLTNFLIDYLELAREISFDSLGSNHNLFLPQSNTDAANLFYNLKFTIF